MNGDTSIAIVLVALILTVGGCLYGTQHDDELTAREKEKTKQIIIQARIDSIKLANKNDSGISF